MRIHRGYGSRESNDRPTSIPTPKPGWRNIGQGTETRSGVAAGAARAGAPKRPGDITGETKSLYPPLPTCVARAQPFPSLEYQYYVPVQVLTVARCYARAWGRRTSSLLVRPYRRCVPALGQSVCSPVARSVP